MNNLNVLAPMQKIKGLTLMGMLLTMAAVIGVGLFIMQIAPVYIQHHVVVSALRALPALSTSEPAILDQTIKKTLMKTLEINGITDINKSNISIEPDGQNQVVVSLQYQVARPFVANISLLFTFNDSQEVAIERE